MFVLSPLLLALSVSAATFTVFDVPASPDATTVSVVSFKPLGVGNDGTTYEIAQAGPTGGPIIHQTIVANSAGIKASFAPQEGIPIGGDAECTWGADNNGVCSGRFSNGAATQTISYSGSILPIFTVTVDDSSAPALPTGASGAGPNSPPSAGSSTPVIGSASPTSNEAATSPSPSNSAFRTLVGSQLYLGMAAVYLLYLL